MRSIWDTLRRHFPPKVTDNIFGMKPVVDMKSAIFDIKAENRKEFEAVV